VEQWEEEGMKTTLFNKTIQYKIQWENEENGYSVPDLNKTMVNVTKEPSENHIKTLREEILDNITKNSWKRY
jgi:hypothetical protein